MDNIDLEILKQDLNIHDEMAKFPQYKLEAWALVYGCMIGEGCYNEEGKVLEETKDIELIDLIDLIEKLSFYKWGEAAATILEMHGLKSTNDIKEIWDGFTRAGVLENLGEEEVYPIRNLMEGKQT